MRASCDFRAPARTRKPSPFSRGRGRTDVIKQRRSGTRCGGTLATAALCLTTHMRRASLRAGDRPLLRGGFRRTQAQLAPPPQKTPAASRLELQSGKTCQAASMDWLAGLRTELQTATAHAAALADRAAGFTQVKSA
eukprot:364307-Chlamydomonas_euryale.AAC.6